MMALGRMTRVAHGEGLRVIGHHVVRITGLLAPKTSAEREPCPLMSAASAPRELALAQCRRERRERVAGPCPQGLQLDRETRSRCHRLGADFGVHPGQRKTSIPGRKEPLFGDPNVVPCPPEGRLEGGDQRGEKRTAQKRIRAPRLLGVQASCFEEPQRGIGGMVVGSLAGIGDSVGDQPICHVLDQRAQDAACGLELALHEVQAGERDERVATPHFEPRKPCDDRGLFARPGHERASRDRQGSARARVARPRITSGPEASRPQP